MKIGFIGLGRMGSAIAGRLLADGHDLAVYNRTAAKATPLGDAGARIAATVAAVAEGRDVVITMVTNDEALDDVARGEGGLLAALPGGAIHLVMGTHGVDAIRLLAEAHAQAGHDLVAAPVLGRPDVAAAGELGIVAAGPAAALDRCRPLLEVIGRRIFEAGDDPAAATAIKITNNFVLVCAIEAMGEAFALVRKYGVKPSVLYDVLTEGSFAAPAYKIYGELIAEEAYDRVGVTAVIGLKDINLALAASEAAEVPLPSAGVVRDRLVGAIAHGDGELDWSVIARDQARASGLE